MIVPDDMVENFGKDISRFFAALFTFCLLLAFFFFACSSVCFAQKEVRIERITVDQGLSQSSISAITQGKYGYLWIATLDGLNRYDGREFKIYRHSDDDPKSLYKDHVSKLFLDNRKTLWVVHLGAIARYNSDNDNFDNFVFPAKSDFHNAVVQDLDNVSDSVLLLSTNHGVLRFNTNNGSVAVAEKFRAFEKQNITNIFTDKNGNEWVISYYRVYMKRKNADEWLTIFSDDIGLRVYHHENSGKIYLQTKTALLKFNDVTGQFEHIDEFTRNEDFDPNNFGMTKLSNGELWLFRKAIYVYDSSDHPIAKLTNIPQNPTSLSGDYLTCIFESNDHVVWIGTNGFGLNKYDPVLSIFKYVGSFEGAPLTLSHNFVYTIFTDDDNLIYVGTFAGLDVLNLNENKSVHYRLKGRDGFKARPQKIFKDSGGLIWLCTDKGLMQFDNKTVRHSGIEMLDTVDTYDVAMTSPDHYFITSNKGIYRFTPSKLSAAMLVPDGSSPIGFMDSTLWTESAYDITRINPGNGKIIQTISKNESNDHAFRSFPIKCFYQDSHGNRWIGSWGGALSLFKSDGSFEYFNEKNGIPNSVVYGILEDKQHNLWLSTNKGLSVFSITQKKSIRNFYKEDGLQGNEFNTKAFYKSPRGKFYFGGTDGLTFFDPEEAMKIRAEIPKTILTGFFVNNVRIERFKDGSIYTPEANNNIVLQYNERNFSFEIAGLGFTSPGRTQYQYMLENFNTSWLRIGNQRIISFTNIPPGNYTFRAKSANSFGEWEKNGLSINIVIKGPFYTTAWFRWAMFALVTLSAYIYYRQRTAVLRARARFLETLVNERTRKIQQMNEEIAAQNEELASQSESLSLQNNELTQIKSSLEHMVDERTVELKKLNGELIRQNSQLEQFAFITAHNIRGPIARMKGLLQFIPKAKMEELALLECCVNDLDEVISDLSVILDVRHGSSRLVETVRLKTTLLQAIRALDAELKKNHATVQLDEFEDISVTGIQSYFNSIFYNLLHNAIRYADFNRPLVVVISAKKNEHATIIEFQDNGIGIDMRYAEGKIFNLYQRFHPGTKGKGFGLFLVKTQIEAMNGSIEVRSEVHKGTTFRMVIPNTQ